MKLGFVGVGKIATSVIEGIFKAKINVKEIILSPKNSKNTKYYNASAFNHILNIQDPLDGIDDVGEADSGVEASGIDI